MRDVSVIIKLTTAAVAATACTLFSSVRSAAAGRPLEWVAARACR